MIVNQLIKGSGARYNHALEIFENLKLIWCEQTNKITFEAIFDKPGEAHIPALPEENLNIPILAGDIFHNLRCTLEYIYRAAYIYKTGNTSKRVQFPSIRKDINGALKSELNHFFDNYEKSIVTLAAANNQDKHRLLLFVAPRLEPLEHVIIDGRLELTSTTNVHGWHDATQPRSYKLGAGVRTRYALIIEEDNGCAQIDLSLTEFGELINQMRMLLLEIHGLMVDAKSVV